MDYITYLTFFFWPVLGTLTLAITVLVADSIAQREIHRAIMEDKQPVPECTWNYETSRYDVTNPQEIR